MTNLVAYRTTAVVLNQLIKKEKEKKKMHAAIELCYVEFLRLACAAY